MDFYDEKMAKALWRELMYIYPELAPPDERTPEEKKRDAEQAKVDLFGPEDGKEEPTCRS